MFNAFKNNRYIPLLLLAIITASCTATPKKTPYISAVNTGLYNLIPKQAVPYASQAELTALESDIGVSVPWNYGRNFSGSVTPIREVRQLDNTICREIQHELLLRGNTKKLFGSKCQKHGKWY